MPALARAFPSLVLRIPASSLVPVLGLAGLLAGCGHSDPGPPTLSVTCDGSLMLAGAASVSAASSAAGATLSFPDPVNPGQTGSLPIQPGHACTLTPDAGKTDSGDGHPSHRAAG